MGRRTNQENEKVDFVARGTYKPAVPHCLNLHRFEEKITGSCAVCKMPLTKDFPADFPSEFKFCCYCLKWAKAVVKTPIAEWVKVALSDHVYPKRILERITIKGRKKWVG